LSKSISEDLFSLRIKFNNQFSRPSSLEEIEGYVEEYQVGGDLYHCFMTYVGKVGAEIKLDGPELKKEVKVSNAGTKDNPSNKGKGRGRKRKAKGSTVRAKANGAASVAGDGGGGGSGGSVEGSGDASLDELLDIS